MSAQSARAQRFEVLGRDGAWKQAAQEMARLCQQPALDYLPPAYAALSLPACFSMTSELYESLEQTEWRTCVVCWRAWYDPPQDYNFQQLVLGRRSVPVPWFNLAESEVLGSKRRHAVNQWRLRGAASAEDAQTVPRGELPGPRVRAHHGEPSVPSAEAVHYHLCGMRAARAGGFHCGCARQCATFV